MRWLFDDCLESGAMAIGKDSSNKKVNEGFNSALKPKSVYANLTFHRDLHNLIRYIINSII